MASVTNYFIFTFTDSSYFLHLYILDFLLARNIWCNFPFFGHKVIQVENTDNGTLFSKIETHMFFKQRV